MPPCRGTLNRWRLPHRSCLSSVPVSHGPLCLNAFPALGEPHGKHRHLPRGQGETALKALQGLVLVAVALSVPGCCAMWWHKGPETMRMTRNAVRTSFLTYPQCTAPEQASAQWNTKDTICPRTFPVPPPSTPPPRWIPLWLRDSASVRSHLKCKCLGGPFVAQQLRTTTFVASVRMRAESLGCLRGLSIWRG